MSLSVRREAENTDPFGDSAARLYFGNVMHARLKPKNHRFNYKIFSLVIDLDRYAEADRTSKLFSVNRSNLVSFFEKDHGPRDGSNLRKHVETLVSEAGVERPERILLWCNPRVFGYTFNPLSIFFCYGSEGELSCLVYQVHNTFGEDHSYVAKVTDDSQNFASIRQTAQKCFYVSPFLDMGLRYDFRIQPPADKLRIRILEHDESGPILSATFSGDSRELSTKQLCFGALKTLGLSFKIVAGIHYEALILWLKGIRLRPRPAPPQKVSFPSQVEKLAPGE
ncbi:MAG: DUF1365 domain-containing protein [Pseudomonadota bacterium]